MFDDLSRDEQREAVIRIGIRKLAATNRPVIRAPWVKLRSHEYLRNHEDVDEWEAIDLEPSNGDIRRVLNTNPEVAGNRIVSLDAAGAWTWEHLKGTAGYLR